MIIGIIIIIFFIVVIGLLALGYKRSREQEISKEGGELIGEDWKDEFRD